MDEKEMKKILKDPETGEIIGATRTLWAKKAKAINEQIQSKANPEAKANQPKVANGEFTEVPRRSAWSGLQFFCGFICIIAGCIFLSKNEGITGIAFIAIGVQAFFVGYLINVFTDIRWFLQESLKVQREMKH